MTTLLPQKKKRPPCAKSPRVSPSGVVLALYCRIRGARILLWRKEYLFELHPISSAKGYTPCAHLKNKSSPKTGGNGAGAPPRGTQETAGALGMGLQASSGLVLLFAFLAYVLPILGGW